jgi:phenylacetate-coenzyme A ligase PaaK-like adenylate-forming protein
MVLVRENFNLDIYNGYGILDISVFILTECSEAQPVNHPPDWPA